MCLSNIMMDLSPIKQGKVRVQAGRLAFWTKSQVKPDFFLTASIKMMLRISDQGKTRTGCPLQSSTLGLECRRPAQFSSFKEYLDFQRDVGSSSCILLLNFVCQHQQHQIHNQNMHLYQHQNHYQHQHHQNQQHHQHLLKHQHQHRQLGISISKRIDIISNQTSLGNQA